DSARFAAAHAASVGARPAQAAAAPSDSARFSAALPASIGTRPAQAAAVPSDSARATRLDRVLTLPEVRVESERPANEARRRLPTAFVSDLATGNTGHALETLAEVLSQTSGVRVVQYGGLGAFSTVSLRGAPSGQVAVFLDGSTLSSAAHGPVN